jgi:DNA-binding Xre family transcriptional regulator
VVELFVDIPAFISKILFFRTNAEFLKSPENHMIGYPYNNTVYKNSCKSIVLAMEREQMISSNVKYIMRKKEKTLREVTEDAQISESTLLKIRKSSLIGECKLNTLRKVAQALGCKVKDLFEEE